MHLGWVGYPDAVKHSSLHYIFLMHLCRADWVFENLNHCYSRKHYKIRGFSIVCLLQPSEFGELLRTVIFLLLR